MERASHDERLMPSRVLVAFALVVGCAPKASMLVTRSARLSVEDHETLACHGEVFCRELVAPRSDPSAREDAGEECARHHGTTTSVPCPREHVRAACRLAGEHGPMTVFAYADDVVEPMSSLCDSVGGALELASAR